MYYRKKSGVETIILYDEYGGKTCSETIWIMNTRAKHAAKP